MTQPRVALFATCLVDLFRPSVGFATVKLLEDAGCSVEVPPTQTCCGQPAWNSGDKATAQQIARQVIAAFEGFDYVVGPSGSCMATIAKDYPAMLADDAEWSARARGLSEKTYEITAFLNDVMNHQPNATCEANVTYHDSCSGLRSLGVQDQPRSLLAGVEGLSLTEMKTPDVCCGFGGTFCVKYPDISDRMASDKTEDIAATGADMVLAGDLGCLMNIAGKLSRQGKPVKARHVVEVLAGMTDIPAIGEGEK
ncbi:MAG: (Fe-S)-binding protein [Pikeienuella sp.]